MTSKNALFQEIWWPLVTSLKSKQKKFIRSIPQHGQKLSFQCPISFSSYFDVSELVSDIDLVLHSLLWHMDKCLSSRNIQKGLYLPFGHTKLVQHRSVIHEIRFLVTCSFGAESILAYFHSENDQIFILWLKIPFGDPKNILQPYQRIVRSSLENHEKNTII